MAGEGNGPSKDVADFSLRRELHFEIPGIVDVPVDISRSRLEGDKFTVLISPCGGNITVKIHLEGDKFTVLISPCGGNITVKIHSVAETPIFNSIRGEKNLRLRHLTVGNGCRRNHGSDEQNNDEHGLGSDVHGRCGLV